MRMDKLTAKFQQALADAQSLAVGRDHSQIEPLHVMLALLNQQGGTVHHLLDNAGVDVKTLRSGLQKAVSDLPTVGTATGDVAVSQNLNR